VLEFKILIGKFFSVDAFASPSVSVGEVTSLEHEVGDNTVEHRSLVMQRLATLSDSLLSGTESTEVLHCLWNSVSKEAEDDASTFGSLDFDVEEDLVGHLGCVSLGRRDQSKDAKRKKSKDGFHFGVVTE
jgi:hypothetical protein